MERNGLFEHVQRDELGALLEFVVLVFVLLLLPNEEFDVLFGLNPQRVWLVVVFIAGLSFFGYLLSKVVDPATAIGVTGVWVRISRVDDHIAYGTSSEISRVLPGLCVRRRERGDY